MTFAEELSRLCEECRPSKHPFFAALARTRPTAEQLGEIYLIYQSAMHATRAAVYRLPYLDSLELRKRKLAILMDDDLGDSHHDQLRLAFRNIGATMIEPEPFGPPKEVYGYLLARRYPLKSSSGLGHAGGHRRTAKFVIGIDRLYAETLGPWCLIEFLSVDWMTALMEALSRHFPDVRLEPYFRECLDAKVEEIHAAESLEITQQIHRERLGLVVNDITAMVLAAEMLTGVWQDMLEVIA